MKEKYGIQNLKIAVLAICKLQFLIQNLISNNKKGWLGFIIKFVVQIVKNFNVYRKFNYKLVDEEFKDLSDEEIRELIVYVSVNLNLRNEQKILAFIKSSINTINKGFNLFG